jgi:hypothetical protein
MAKGQTQKAVETEAPAGAIVQTNGTAEITDTRTGEVVQAGQAGISASEEFDAEIAARLSQGNMAALLQRTVTSKPEEFEAPEADFLDMKKPGDKLQGVYLGSKKMGRLIQHAVAVPSAKDPKKPTVKRINGTHGLTRALSDIAPGTGVYIEFVGKTGTMSGNTFRNWIVKKLNA